MLEPIPFAGWVNTAPPHVVDSGASIMKAKPVAWIDPYDLERLPLNDCWVNGQKSKWADLPLYAHPVKELTDEEIDEAWKSVDHTIEYSKYRIEIARAILTKAQEK